MDNTLVFNIELNYLLKFENKLVETINQWLDANHCITFVTSNTFGLSYGEIIIAYEEKHKEHIIKKLVKQLLERFNIDYTITT